MFRKLKPIKMPDIENVHTLCRERVTSQGVEASIGATDAPKPNNTSSDGSAQHKSVLRDVNNEK
jgi:hypothetical protein